MNEANTCRTDILPKPRDGRWEEDTILKQVILTPGWIVPVSIGTLRKFKFMHPPLEEQQRLVAYLDGLSLAGARQAQEPQLCGPSKRKIWSGGSTDVG